MELSSAADILRRSDRFLLITHRRPDGDTLGCAGALCHALRRMGKTAYVFPNPEITESYLPFLRPYLADTVSGSGWFTLAVDVADPALFCSGFRGKIDLWLDHHPSRGAAREPGVICSERASCGELVLELIRLLLGAPDIEEADLLYIAVSTDTGCFCYANTNAATHIAAAKLIEAGAHSQKLNKNLFRTKSRSRLLLEGMVYSTLRSFREGAVNAALVTLDMLRSSGVDESDCEDLAGLVGQLDGYRVGITIRELSASPARSKISLRTDGSVDAAVVCGRFGGGGHKMASGCEIEAAPEEALAEIIAAVDAEWP